MRRGEADSKAAIERRLRDGGVVLLATDTLPGLHCRFDNATAVDRISALKGRPAGKPMVVLAGSASQARQVTAGLTPEQWSICRSHWPGPFSFILPANPDIDQTVTGGRQTIAVRVPAHDALRTLLRAVGVPLVSTSANHAGQPPATTMQEAAAIFGDQVDGVWPAESQDVGGAQPSTLVDLTANPFQVLRKGPLAFDPQKSA